MHNVQQNESPLWIHMHVEKLMRPVLNKGILYFLKNGVTTFSFFA